MGLGCQIHDGNFETPVLGALKMNCSDEQAIYSDMWSILDTGLIF